MEIVTFYTAQTVLQHMMDFNNQKCGKQAVFQIPIIDLLDMSRNMPFRIGTVGKTYYFLLGQFLFFKCIDAYCHETMCDEKSCL